MSTDGMTMDAKKVVDRVVIGLCTLRRNEQLKEAMDSLSHIERPSGTEVEFVLIDNDENAGAKRIFDAYEPDMPFKSHYFVEARRGLSHARNRVIEEALKLKATAIAMFDDDEIVDDKWLVELYKTFRTVTCDGVCGQVYRSLPLHSSRFIKKFWPNSYFPEGVLVRMIASGNCLFSANLVSPDGMNIRFDDSFNFSGRGDLVFSFDAQLKGAKFFFASDAIVIEKFPASRATFRYLLRRWFENGITDLMVARRYKFGTVRRTINEVARILSSFLLVPLMAIRGPVRQCGSILRLALSMGWVCGLFGKSANYYAAM
ncbi:MAG: glycosyltransferase [Puniceicoccales bacterium]|jgi:succinoglycan biosynthesis protein ExoM|nr:glycosyltransferase [Puniceicoccales bacterium]